MNTAKRIYYVSAPCGAGKTTAAVRYIKENIGNKNFVVVVPTILMVEQWAKALEEQGLAAEAITSNSCAGNVKRLIIDGQNKFKPQGHIQIITWNAYVDLRYRAKHKNIQVIIDEVPQTDRFFPWNISNHIDELASSIKIEHPINDRISKVCASSFTELDLNLKSPGDDIDLLFEEFKRHVMSPYRDVYVDAAAYDQVFCRRNTSKDDREVNRVGFLSMLNPLLFEGSILLGANVEQSVLYKWLTTMFDVRFAEKMEISRCLQPQFRRGHLLNLYYFFKGDTLASKYRFDCIASNGRTVIDEMDRHALELLGEQPFLFVANKDRKAPLIKVHAGAMHLPVDSRGLNSYRDYDNIYFSAALNRQPYHIRMLEDLGLASQDLYRATTCEQAYQALFRTSLRDQSAGRAVTAIVPDLITANYISDCVGGAEIRKLEIQHEWKAKALTQTQKKQRMRAKTSLKEIIASKSIPFSSLKEDGGQTCESFHWVTPPGQRGELAALVVSGLDLNRKTEVERGNQITCYVTLHEKLQASDEKEHQVIKVTPMEFVRLLKTQWRSVQDDKHGRLLFNPATFRRDEGGCGWRTLANFQSSYLMVLDFDGGRLSPEQFWKIFGPDAGPSRQLNFALYNSFSRSPEEPNRFHAVVFFREPARSVYEHRAVFDGIVRRLEDEGFNRGETGLDPASSRGVQSFYLPATNRAFPDMAFFKTHGVTARELASAIVPSLYAKTKLTQTPRLVRSQKLRSDSCGNVDKILSPLHGMRTNRHHALFLAASNLQRLGFTPSEIEVKLVDVFGTDRKIAKKIRDANKSLARYRSSQRQSANNFPS